MSSPNKLVVIALACLLCAGVANAGLIPFNGIVTRDSNLDDIAIGEMQFHMQFDDLGAGLAAFTFENTGPNNAFIDAVYFDGDIINSIFMLIPGAGVLFSPRGNPMDLPGGNMIGFMSDVHATADMPQSPNGIDPGEMLEIQMSYTGTFADLTAAILSAELRIGVSAGGMGPLKEGSEAFVNKPVPAPGALALLGIAGLIGRRRRRG